MQFNICRFLYIKKYYNINITSISIMHVEYVNEVWLEVACNGYQSYQLAIGAIGSINDTFHDFS